MLTKANHAVKAARAILCGGALAIGIVAASTTATDAMTVSSQGYGHAYGQGYGGSDGERYGSRHWPGLTDDEIRQVDGFVRNNTIEKFGPVRRVKPELVFELAFEAIQRSARHRSGIAVRFPRMARWRTDKKAEDADSIETIRALLPAEP